MVDSFMLLSELWWSLWTLLRGRFGRVWFSLFWRSWVRPLIKSIERLFSAKETSFLQRAYNYAVNVSCTKACFAFTSMLPVNTSHSSHKQFQNHPSSFATLWSAANTMEWAREDFPVPIWTKRFWLPFRLKIVGAYIFNHSMSKSSRTHIHTRTQHACSDVWMRVWRFVVDSRVTFNSGCPIKQK